MNDASANATEIGAVQGTELKNENVLFEGRHIRPSGLSKVEKRMLSDTFYFPSKDTRNKVEAERRKAARKGRKGIVLEARPVKGPTRVEREMVQAMRESGETPALKVKVKVKVKPKKMARRRGYVGMTIGDFATSIKVNPAIVVKGRLPYPYVKPEERRARHQRYDDMQYFEMGDRKPKYHVPEALPIDIQRKYRQLLHDRYIRRKRRQNWKMCEGTLRAFDNKYL